MSVRTTVENSTKREVEVNFSIVCDDFTVPEWHGLKCYAEFEVYGFVTFDKSGDRTTPNGPPSVNVGLLDPKEYIVSLATELSFTGDASLPDWLQYRLVSGSADEFDAAFLVAIGGQEKLDQLAIEKASE